MVTLLLHTLWPLTIVINLETHLPIFANSPSCHKFVSSSSLSWNSHEPATKLNFADMCWVTWFWTLCRFNWLKLTRMDFFRFKYAIHVPWASKSSVLTGESVNKLVWSVVPVIGCSHIGHLMRMQNFIKNLLYSWAYGWLSLARMPWFDNAGCDLLECKVRTVWLAERRGSKQSIEGSCMSQFYRINGVSKLFFQNTMKNVWKTQGEMHLMAKKKEN